MASPASVDGLEPQPANNKAATSSAKLIVIVVLMMPYLAYLMWCLFLISVLPNPAGNYQGLVSVGVISCLTFGFLLLVIAGLLIQRIFKVPTLDQRARLLSAAKVILLFTPGLALSVLTPLLIPKEPRLAISLVSPVDPAELVAPLAVTFSLQPALDILANRGLKPVKFAWDYDGDGKPNEETVEPQVVAAYERKGFYQVVARVYLTDGSQRRLVYPLSIPKAVFAFDPVRPVVDEPVAFSLAHIDSKEIPIKEVKWDFQSDGEIDVTTSEIDTTHTFIRTGPFTVTAKILFANQAQTTLQRTLEVSQPEPLPFPVTINTEPQFLLSPPPFGVIFSLETDEPHHEVRWNFGDGQEATGQRVGHTFREKGVHRVVASVRSLSGATAKVVKTVRVVDVLRINDLGFDGTPEVAGNRLAGEVPVTVELTPRTSLPLVEFFWEAPKATLVESTATTLRATYRRPGNYIITLVGTDPSGSVLRLPLSLEVKQPSSIVTMRMQPDGGVAPLLVRFDASETVIPGQEISGFEWTFGDDAGSEPRQGGAQIEYLFEKQGTYEVELTAYTTSGDSFSERRTIVIRAPVLDACFTTSRTSGVAPLGVSFDMSCTTGEPLSLEWDFGDGAKSTERAPIHVFERPGNYNVTLKLQGESGSVSRETINITALSP